MIRPVASILLILAALPWTACGGGAEQGRPRPAVSKSTEAQAELRRLLSRWDAERRAELEVELTSFVRRYPNDELGRVARVYLAWLLIERGKLVEAHRELRVVRRGPVGSVRDFARVAEAAILVRSGKAGAALALLAPLDGKIIDLNQRRLYDEQRVLAALAARRWRLAVAYMQAFVEEAPPELRSSAETHVERWIEQVPVHPLQRAYEDLAAADEEDSDEVGEARAWLGHAILARLVRHTLAHDDASLASWLLRHGPVSLRTGRDGDALLALSARVTVLPKIVGRSLGLVLSLGTGASRRRSVSVSSGVSRGLGLLEGARTDSVNLIVRDDTHGMDQALGALAGAGASILIAAVDERSADEARAYAARMKIPVMLMHAPSGGVKPDGFTFVLAPRRAAELDALRAAVAEKAGDEHVEQTRSIAIGGDELGCDARATRAGDTRFPVLTWKREQVQTVMILGDEFCARDVAAELRRVGFAPLLALGLEAAHLYDDASLGSPRVAIKAGKFPDELEEDQHKPFYDLLGYDAALLAEHALQDFPLAPQDDVGIVAQLHERARSALARAQAPLVTASSRGFAGGRVVERDLSTVE